MGKATPSQVIGCLEHLVPQRNRIGRVFAYQDAGERTRMVVSGRAAHDGLNGWSHGLCFPNTSQAGVGLDYKNTVVVGAVEEFDQRVFGAQVNSLNRGDSHSLLFRPPGES